MKEPTKRETGWVIESYLFSETHYWTGELQGYGDRDHLYRKSDFGELFDRDHKKAMRFARMDDAQMVLSRFLENHGRVVKHIWGLG